MTRETPADGQPKTASLKKRSLDVTCTNRALSAVVLLHNVWVFIWRGLWEGLRLIMTCGVYIRRSVQHRRFVELLLKFKHLAPWLRCG